MPRYAPNKMPTAVKKRYFELIRSGMKGAAAARVVGVSTSCGSLWFLDAGVVIINAPRPISPRFLTQDDRIAIADGLHAGWSKKQIAAGIGKSFQTVYQLDVLGGGRPAHQQDQSEYLPEGQIQEAQRHGGDHAQPSKTADHRWSATGDRVLEPHRSTPARIVYELAAAMVIPDLRYEMSLDATPAYTLTRWSPPADRDLASVITYETSCGLSVQILFTG